MGIGPCCLKMSARALKEEETTQWDPPSWWVQPQRKLGYYHRPFDGWRPSVQLQSQHHLVLVSVGIQGRGFHAWGTGTKRLWLRFPSFIHFTPINSEPFQNTDSPNKPVCHTDTIATGPWNANSVKGSHHWPQVQWQVTNIRGTNFPMERHTLRSMYSPRVTQVSTKQSSPCQRKVWFSCKDRTYR